MKKIISIFMIIITLMSVASFATTPIEPRTVETPMLINETTAAVGEETIKNMGDNFILEAEDYKISNQIINGNEFVMVSKKTTIENTIINGNLFIFSDEIEINNTTITGSAFILSKDDVKIENSNISDIYILASNIELKEKTIINREVKILAQTVELNALINGNSYIHANKVEIQDKAILNGNNNIQYKKEYNKSENAVIKNIEENKIEKNAGEELVKNNVKTELLNWVSLLIKTAIVVGIVFLFNYKKFETFIIQNKEGKKLTKLSLKGFLWLILIPILAFIILFISFGLLFGISIILIMLYGIYIYIAIPVVSFAIALIIKNKYIKKEIKFELFGLTLIIASLLWVLTKFPILGVLINFVILILAFGIIIEYIFKVKKIKNEEEIIIEPEVK